MTGHPKTRLADTFPLADAQAVLADLYGSGWTRARVARQAGLSENTLTHIAQGRKQRVTAATYERLSGLRGDGTCLADRFDPEPLIAAIRNRGSGVPPDDWLRQQVCRWRAEGGLSWWQADRWAARLGLHPADPSLWGDAWWADAG